MLLKLLGYILTLLGLLLGTVAGAVGFGSKDQGSLLIAAVIGVIALLFLVVGYKSTRQRRSRSWRSDPATDKQREFARELGIKFPKKITKGELSDLISLAKGK